MDRYFIPLAAVLLIPLIRYYQERIQLSAPAVSFAALAIFSLYGVASTHDYFATNRARLRAAEEVRGAGVPRTAIQGGWNTTAGRSCKWLVILMTGAFQLRACRLPHLAAPVYPPNRCSATAVADVLAASSVEAFRAQGDDHFLRPARPSTDTGKLIL